MGITFCILSLPYTSPILSLFHISQVFMSTKLKHALYEWICCGTHYRVELHVCIL